MSILLIDDERDFRDGRDYKVIRSSAEAIEFFQNENPEFDEVWLDYILAGSDTMFDFAVFADNQACNGSPLKVKKFIIHTSSNSGYSLLKDILGTSGAYTLERFWLSDQDKTAPVIY